MKIFVLTGETMSGKTTIANLIENQHKIKRTISFTTRPKRENEIDGVDYNFYDQATALYFMALGKVSAMKSYQPHESCGPFPWYYGFLTSDIIKNEVSFLITEQQGILDLREKFGSENVSVIYLDISEEDQMKRIEERGDKLKLEQLRRIKKDKEDFKNIKNNADHIIDATKKPVAIAKEIAKLIEKNS